ncbi:MAG: 50S ribosomal protein L24 [Firmicutes bacterium]|nr:50S ribosomal protein L24 [Bacillota bacterium]
MRVRTGDTVLVIAGRDKGKQGKIIRALPKERRVVVEKVNLVKKHQKARPGMESGIITMEAPIAVSNVMLICPSCKTPTRVAKRFTEDGRKVRVCKRCGAVIS